MPRARVAVVAAAVVLVCCASSAASGTARSYSDPQGDQEGNAPDVTTITVSNDRQGNIIWRIDVANQRTLAADSAVELWIDSDRNPSTGAPDTLGSDYVFVVAADGYNFARWTGREYDFDTPFSTVAVAYEAGARITVNRRELGDTTRFNFWARGLRQTSPETDDIDDAPNSGTFAYVLTAPAPRHGVVGARSMTRVSNGLHASFTFREQPVAGSRVRIVFKVNGRQFAQRTFGARARTVAVTARGLGKGLYSAELRVRPPGAAWRTLATVRRRL
jgi:hypothetical protein